MFPFAFKLIYFHVRTGLTIDVSSRHKPDFEETLCGANSKF